MAVTERDLLKQHEAMEQAVLWDVQTVDEAVSRLGNEWSPNYLAYKDSQTRDLMHAKIDKIASVINATEEEVEVSQAYIDRVFDTWESPDKLDGYESFVFMVPTRAIRGNGFAPEFKPFIPLIDKLGPNSAQLLLVGLPPFIVDSYQPNAEGKRGAMVFAPGFYDILNDVPLEEAGNVFNTVMDDAVKFSRDKLGASSVGLGATLPAVTDYGRTINVDGITTTTGHGGTVHLINETVRSALQTGRIDEIRGLGVLGLGSIGASIANVLATNNPEVPMSIYDLAEGKIERTHGDLGKILTRTAGIEVAKDAYAMLANPDINVIVSAVTNPVDLSQLPKDALKGKLIVDDSQPTAFALEQATGAGATLAWPIGEDTTSDGVMTRTTFDYGDLGPKEDSQNWGCELEAYLTSIHPDLALRKPVTPASSLVMSLAIHSEGIAEAARLQSFGQYV